MSQPSEFDNNCKGCSASVQISPEEIAALFTQSFKVKEVKVVTEEQFTERIKTCLICPALEYGTTCKYCGCLVHLKAKLSASKCPFPYAPKWSATSGSLETKQPTQP